MKKVPELRSEKIFALEYQQQQQQQQHQQQANKQVVGGVDNEAPNVVQREAREGAQQKENQNMIEHNNQHQVESSEQMVVTPTPTLDLDSNSSSNNSNSKPNFSQLRLAAHLQHHESISLNAANLNSINHNLTRKQPAANLLMAHQNSNTTTNNNAYQQHHQAALIHQQRLSAMAESPTPAELARTLFGQHSPVAAHDHHHNTTSSIEQYLIRQQNRQQLLAMEHLRSMSSCSNGSSSNGRNSSIGDHCFLEPFDMMDCTTSSSSSSSSTTTSTTSCASSATNSQQQASLFSRLTRRMRILESPTDSGIESGKENGTHSALGFSCNGLRSTTPNESSSSACMSPINGLSAHNHHHHHHHSHSQPQPQHHNHHNNHHHLSAAEILYHCNNNIISNNHHTTSATTTTSSSSSTANSFKSQNLDNSNNLLHMRPASALGHLGSYYQSSNNGKLLYHQNQQQQQQQQNQASSVLNHSISNANSSSNLNLNANASNTNQSQSQNLTSSSPTADSGSIDDMPMLKRALQAPPLINTNMLMDEAYRHHKKFRAAQRKELGDSHAVGSTSGTNSSASNHPPLSNCPSTSISPAASPTPSTANHQQRRSNSCSEHSPDSSKTANKEAATAQNGELSNHNNSSTSNNSTSSSSLANMHSTLLKKLNQPSNLQMSQQQLKCNDLIHEIILQDDGRDDKSSPESAIEQRQQRKQINDHNKLSPIPSGAVAPASSPVSTSSQGADSPKQTSATASVASTTQPTLPQSEQQLEQQRLFLADSGNNSSDASSNLQRILISEQQQQQQRFSSLTNGISDAKAARLQLLGGLSHHLVDEDYIAKRLLNSGAYRRHQQQHSRHHHHHHHHRNHQSSQQQAGSGAHNHHRPSSSCASSSSPSPTSSLSTLSPSPTYSVSPDLGMISQRQLHSAVTGPGGATIQDGTVVVVGNGNNVVDATADSMIPPVIPLPNNLVIQANQLGESQQRQQQQQQQTSSYQYIDQHLNYHKQRQQELQQRESLNLMIGSQPQLNGRDGSTMSPTCDLYTNGVSSSISSPQILNTVACNVTNSLSQISKLSLNCSTSNTSNGSGQVANKQLDHHHNLLPADFAPTHHLVSGASKISLMKSVKASEGGFGLLADVAIAAAEEQSRMELELEIQQQHQQQQQSTITNSGQVVAQPIDLSKK